MEINRDLRLTELVENIHEILLDKRGKICTKQWTKIKVSDGNLSTYGDLNFPISLDVWRKLIANDSQSISRYKNILEYFLVRNKIDFKDDDKDVAEKAFRNIIEASIDWYFKIENCALKNERVCVFLNRRNTFSDVICHIVKNDISYGTFESNRNRSFCFDISFDDESELTNLRLRLIKGVAENLIRAHGYQTSENVNSNKYELTTKSGKVSENHSKTILCGVVLNSVTGQKETSITEREYLKMRINDHELLSSDRQNSEQNSVDRKLAEGAIGIEFLAMKPSREIAPGLGDLNYKGASFVLYNTARISALFEKFEDERSRGNYPKLSDINDVDFSLLRQEDEWELLYKYVLGYPELIKSSLRLEEYLEIGPHHICNFLHQFCKKFSAYYRRVRILTEGREHLLPTMMVRLYLLKAVQIVICNALRLLNIDPVSRM